ncbi:MAG: hypothetical protein AAF787_06640 [Chloroflexota bacterium]
MELCFARVMRAFCIHYRGLWGGEGEHMHAHVLRFDAGFSIGAKEQIFWGLMRFARICCDFAKLDGLTGLMALVGRFSAESGKARGVETVGFWYIHTCVQNSTQ